MVTLSGPDGAPYRLAPTKIIALGLNYRDHIAESQSVKVQGFGQETPKEPVLFPKSPNVLIGPGEPIVIPAFLEDYRFEDPRVDYEAELAFVVRDRCRHVAEAEAWEHILGFTCFNDVSQRNLQRSEPSGWWRGKSLDTFGPVGPRIVARRELGDPAGPGHPLPAERPGGAGVPDQPHDLLHPADPGLRLPQLHPGGRGPDQHGHPQRGGPASPRGHGGGGDRGDRDAL